MRVLKLAIVSLLTLSLIAAAAWYWLGRRVQAPTESPTFDNLAADLRPLIRAEGPDAEILAVFQEHLQTLSYAEGAEGLLARAALSFLAGDPKTAAYALTGLATQRPRQPDLISFLAAANLRQGNNALAEDLYLQALTLRTQAGHSDLDLSHDQLGLALSFLARRQSSQAEPLTRQAHLARFRALGPRHPDTLWAARYLAAALAAADQLEEAKALLHDIVLKSAQHPELVPLRQEAQLILAAAGESASSPEAEPEAAAAETKAPAAERWRRLELSPPAGEISAQAAEALRQARSLEERRLYREAGQILEQAAAVANEELPQRAAESLILHLLLADNYLAQGRSPVEAEIELRAGLARIKGVDKYPESGPVYLRLAELLWTLERPRESADFFRRAEKSSQKLLAGQLSPQAKALAEDSLQRARQALKALANGQSVPPPPPES